MNGGLSTLRLWNALPELQGCLEAMPLKCGESCGIIAWIGG